MYCPNCGNELKDEAVFCPNCGMKIESEEAPKVVYSEPADVLEDSSKKRKIEKGYLIGGVIGLIAFSVILIVAWITGTQKNMSSYFISDSEFSESVQGANGYGSVERSADSCLDIEQLYCDLFDVDHQELDQLIEAEAAPDYEQFDNIVSNAITVNYISPTEKLSNDSEIALRAVINYDQINNIYGIKHKLHGDTIEEHTYTIRGLKDVVKVDPFRVVKNLYKYPNHDNYYEDMEPFDIDGFHIEQAFDYSGEYLVTDINSGKTVAKFNIVEKTENETIEVGKKIVLSIDTDKEKYINEGIVFTRNEKTYTVLDNEILTDKNMLTPEIVGRMEYLIDKRLGAKLENSWSVKKMYLLIPNNPNEHDTWLIALCEDDEKNEFAASNGGLYVTEKGELIMSEWEGVMYWTYGDNVKKDMFKGFEEFKKYDVTNLLH